MLIGSTGGAGPAGADTARSASSTDNAATIAATCSGDGLPPTTSTFIYSGVLPCLRAGICSRFVRSIASARASIRRVSRGSITSST